MIFQMTLGGSELPNDPQRSHQGNGGMNVFHHSETLMITDEILLRRIKNRERQRRYRERKRLEADKKKSHLIEHRLFFPAETPPNAVYEKRVHSGRKWKKEARRVYFSTRLENMEFEEALTVAELATKEHNGRRDWKADARKKMEFEGGEALGLSVWSDIKMMK
ncbi:hypothetical protein KSP39_PZI018942 [Platanthera zijinensis]|uniref:Uncharacterized protein n=1 Tax=Platanthera zijinensis TaxID=2320716 RepID=A0AAP0B464_9ASPA